MLPHGAGGSPTRCPHLRTTASSTTATSTSTSWPLLLGASSLLVTLALTAARAAAGHRRNAAGAAAPPPSATLLLGLMASGSHAHNWMHGLRSRANYDAGKASTVKPCRARTQFRYPNVQVNAGQEFMAEWMTGHGGDTMFFVLKAEDERALDTIGPHVFKACVRPSSRSSLLSIFPLDPPSA